MVVAIGGAAAQGGIGVQTDAHRGHQTAQVRKAGGLGKPGFKVALADLKAAQTVHGTVCTAQRQQKELDALYAPPLRCRANNLISGRCARQMSAHSGCHVSSASASSVFLSASR